MRERIKRHCKVSCIIIKEWDNWGKCVADVTGRHIYMWTVTQFFVFPAIIKNILS